MWRRLPFEDGKVFVTCELKEFFKDDFDRSVRKESIKIVNGTEFIEYGPCMLALMDIIRLDNESQAESSDKDIKSGEMTLTLAGMISSFGVTASLTEFAARTKAERNFIYIDGVKFLIFDENMIFRCDDFMPYIWIHAKGPLRDEIDRVSDPRKSDKRATRVEYDNKSYYSWDLVYIGMLGAHLVKFKDLDLSNEKEVGKWYSEMANSINKMVHDTQSLFKAIAGLYKHM